MAGMAALLEASELSGERASVRLLEGMEATWDDVLETDGTLQLQRLLAADRRAARARAATAATLAAHDVKRGMVRHVVLVLDLSQEMEDEDLRPTRWDCALQAAEAFVRSFFDQNPISHMAIAVMRGGRAELVADMTGNMTKLIEQLQYMSNHRSEFYPHGEASLQNTITLCTKLLTAVAAHSTREVIIVVGSLTSCDPGNIYETIKQAVEQRVRISIVGLAAATKLCQTIAHDTHGTYSVVLDEAHLHDLLQQHTVPPVAAVEAKSALVRMGFPTFTRTMLLDKKRSQTAGGQVQEYAVIESGVYTCPRCMAHQTGLPTECSGCGLFLVLTPHLARTFHHLFPLDEFAEEERDASDPGSAFCAGCTRALQRHVYRCPKCQGLFCSECDIFIHDTLHNCPGCSHG